MQQNEKLWNPNYNKVMFANLTLYFSFYLITPLLPLYLSETFHSTKDTIGFVLSGYILVALLIRPFSGYIVDSFPRKTVMLVCMLLNFMFFGGYIAGSTLLAFAIFRTLHGGPFGATTVANSTMAVDVLPSSRRSEGIGYYGLSNNLASALGPTVGIFIYRTTHNFEMLFWTAFIAAGIGFLICTTIDAPQKAQVKNKQPISFDRFFLTRGWFLALNICFFGFCWGLLSNYLAIYSKEHLGITSGTGTYFMILSAGLIASRLQGAKSLREGRLIHNAYIGIILSTIGFVMFIAYPTMIGYYTSAVLIGLGNGHMWPAFQNMIIGIASNRERGTANSTILTSWDLGMGLGILAGGVVSERLGYDAAFWTMAAMQIAGLLSFVMLTPHRYRLLAETQLSSNK